MMENFIPERKTGCTRDSFPYDTHPQHLRYYSKRG